MLIREKFKIMNQKNILILILLILICSSCGKDKAAAAAAIPNACHIDSGSFGGCCSSHGGAYSNCAIGEYLFTSDKKLVCNDSTISPTCVGHY